MKKLTKLSILMLSAAFLFAACANNSNNDNDPENLSNKFNLSAKPLFPKTDCTELVTEEVTLSDGNWTFQEHNGGDNVTWNFSLTEEEKNTLFSLLSDEETAVLKPTENFVSNTGYYQYSLPTDRLIGSYMYKFSISNGEASSADYECYIEMNISDETVKNILLKIPNRNYKLKDNTIIHMYQTTSNVINMISNLAALSRKDPNYNDIDIYRNTDSTKYYFRTWESYYGDSHLDEYWQKDQTTYQHKKNTVSQPCFFMSYH